MSVVSLEDYRTEQHCEGDVRCLTCRHEWHAVVPVGVVWMQCPRVVWSMGGLRIHI